MSQYSFSGTSWNKLYWLVQGELRRQHGTVYLRASIRCFLYLCFKHTSIDPSHFLHPRSCLILSPQIWLLCFLVYIFSSSSNHIMHIAVGAAGAGAHTGDGGGRGERAEANWFSVHLLTLYSIIKPAGFSRIKMIPYQAPPTQLGPRKCTF